jgi:4-amino-4-deoxy-L-arabinose transferase-like glycosyltransferase
MRHTILILIILLASCLRLHALGTHPATLYGDEQAFAWNAYNILKTGADEYGTPYPLQFRSFEDYKAPIPVYILVPFIDFFGLTVFAIRLPIALAAIATIYATYLLTGVFFRKKIALLTAFFLTISPWHIHVSRGYFETTLSLFFFLLGTYFFMRDGRLKHLLISMVFYAMCIYTYFTPRIFLPMFIVFLIFYTWKRYQFKYVVISLITLIVICLPMAYATIFGPGFSRFGKLSESTNNIVTTTVIHERNASGFAEPWRQLFHNKYLVRVRLLKDDYLEHFSINFWYLYGDTSLRYFLGNMGMFYLIELPVFIVGLFVMIRLYRSYAVFFLGWLLLAPIPAALVGPPYGLRSLALLPVPFIFISLGVVSIMNWVSSYSKTIFIIFLTLCWTISCSIILLRYYVDYPVYAATWWGYENKAEIDYAKDRESQYDNIFLSDYYSGSTLAYAVYSAYDPVQYRYAINHPVILADGRKFIKLGKFYFGSLDLDKTRLSQGLIPPKSLYIGRPFEADSDENIFAPDDKRILFKIYHTN